MGRCAERGRSGEVVVCELRVSQKRHDATVRSRGPADLPCGDGASGAEGASVTRYELPLVERHVKLSQDIE